MDFYKVANEIVSWAETLSGAFVFYTSLAVLTFGACYYGNRIRKCYKKKYGKPEEMPFKTIPNLNLPKSEFKI